MARKFTPTDWELIQRAREDDQEAWRILFKRHSGCMYRLTIRIVRRKGGEMDDCLSLAHEAFIRCVRNFNPDKHCQFVTLLWRAVKNAVWKYDPGGPIYIPSYAFSSPKEGIKQAAYKALYTYAIDRDNTESQGSYEGNANPNSFAELLVDDKDPPFSQMERQEELQVARHLLSQLNLRHQEILIRRFRGETLIDISIDLGVTKERVRQLEQKALKTLRSLEFKLPSG